jgi:hypothetical protein
MGSIEQRCQCITRGSWTKLSHDALRSRTRKVDRSTRLRPNRFQNVAQG